MGAGGAEGAIDAANLLKPALARGELRCIGATTLNEYKKHVEKDAALARRFQTVLVGEPTVDDTVAILRGLKEKFEIHHGVRIKDSAIIAAALLSHRYIADRFLPDKAIDLIDEAGSALRLQIGSMPIEIDDLDRRISHLEIERQALTKEDDAASHDRLRARGKRAGAAARRSGRPQRTLEPREEPPSAACASSRKSRIGLRQEEEKASRAGDWEKAAQLRYGRLAQIEKDIQAAEQELEAVKENALLKEEIGEDDIARIVAKWTGIPVTRMMEGEIQKLVHMPERLKDRVVGQDEAVRLVSNAILRNRAGLSDPNRPIGSFIFLGPTGVGKTELVRALAQYLFDDDKAMIRVDMSRVPGEALGGAHDRLASRICRLRRGRPAHRTGAPPALLGGPVRRNRKGPPGRLQHAAADSGRRPPDRWPGPHGQLQQHRDRDDLQRGHRDGGEEYHRLFGAGQGSRTATIRASGCSDALRHAVPPRVSEPHRRYHRI